MYILYLRDVDHLYRARKFRTMVHRYMYSIPTAHMVVESMTSAFRRVHPKTDGLANSDWPLL